MSKLFSSIVLVLFVAATSQTQWQRHNVNTTADFRGLSVVNENIAWSSGTKGTFLRTVDGKLWQVGTVQGAEALDFRDIEAFDANTAYILSVGAGESSRIYKTTDGGNTWGLQFKNTNPKVFLTAFAFWDDKNGIAISNPVDGHYQLITTEDGGVNWKPLIPQFMPLTFEGESSFTVSGTCITVQGSNNIWFVTGGTTARVFSSTNRGLTWTVRDTPLMNGVENESAGIFSVAFYDAESGIVVGGDYRKPNDKSKTIALTINGGYKWMPIKNSTLSGFRSCIVYVPGTKGKTWVAAGSSGSDISTDGGLTWKELDKGSYHTVGFANSKTGWAVGPNGTVARFIAR